MKAYKQFPALAKFIDRIGAEQLNFKTFMVKEYRHRTYYLEKCLIKLDPDGDVRVSNKDYAPSKEEKEAIKKELAGNTNFPRCITASEAQLDDLLAKIKAEQKGDWSLHQFWDLPRKGIIMAQLRYIKSDGEKAFCPWTFFDDEQWRMAEPDEGLPFWKPKQIKSREGGLKIMIHEGAKTAEFVHGLCNDKSRAEELKAHPYGDVLSEYEHWGMIGGALAPHRADYRELHKAKPLGPPVYVCDADYPGNSALQKVSKQYGRALRGVQFGDGFPSGFDLADPMPEKFFKGGVWLGPRWNTLLVVATHATNIMPNPEGTGRPLTLISPDFAQECWHTVKPEAFLFRDTPSVLYSAEEFNHKVAPFSDADDTARLMKKDGATISANISYQPNMKPGLYPGADGGSYINTHVPSPIKAKAGDYKPFVDYMQYLIPEESERMHLMRWCATLIAQPSIKMMYSVLLVSETQGIGKSTLGEKILAPLLGEGNVSFPSEADICESNYNYWAPHRRLAVVHEIYAGHSVKAYNKLKAVIADSTITVSKKYMAPYEIENWVHVFACSNSTRAIQLSADDRRWFVPRVTEEKQPFEFWERFNKWLREEEGLAKIKFWAEEFVRSHGHVLRGDTAPWSTAKKEMVEDNYSTGMALFSSVLAQVRNVLEAPEQAERRAELERQGYVRDGKVIIVDLDGVTLIREVVYEGRHNDRLEKPLTIRKVAKSSGFFVGETKLPWKRWGTKHFKGRIISNCKSVAGMSPTEIPDEWKVLPLEKFRSM